MVLSFKQNYVLQKPQHADPFSLRVESVIITEDRIYRIRCFLKVSEHVYLMKYYGLMPEVPVKTDVPIHNLLMDFYEYRDSIPSIPRSRLLPGGGFQSKPTSPPSGG